MKHELRRPETEKEWNAYHSIRERVLWEARGRLGEYDRSHPDDRKDGNHPFLLMFEGSPIGVVRIDLAGETAFFRRVAISEALQRMGHGRTLLNLAEQFARKHGCTEVCSNVDPDAVEFYRNLGYRERGPTLVDRGVPMQKDL